MFHKDADYAAGKASMLYTLALVAVRRGKILIFPNFFVQVFIIIWLAVQFLSTCTYCGAFVDEIGFTIFYAVALGNNEHFFSKKQYDKQF